jgi:formylglycine-generating enzyme required for sulfatase activity/WD40 repeat protein
VKITKPFYLGAYEVTQKQFAEVMGIRPWQGKDEVREGSDYPATGMSWNDAVEFCRKLSEQEGEEYRLPTEAEWEYACRAGTTTIYSFGDDASQLGRYAWFKKNARDIGQNYAHRVGQKLPNPWGLYDMHGNVCEWCQDWYAPDGSKALTDPMGPTQGKSRQIRGDSFTNQAQVARSAKRYIFDLPVNRTTDGFRVAMKIDTAKQVGPAGDPTSLSAEPPIPANAATTQIDRPQAKPVDEPVGEVVCFREHTDMVWTARFSPDSKTVVSASEDGTVRLWNVAGDNTVKFVARHPVGALGAEFVGDGSRIVLAGMDGVAALLDCKTGRRLKSFRGHTGKLWSVTPTRDGRRILTTSEDGTARVWSVANGRELVRFTGHKGPVFNAIFAPDEETAVSCGADKTARLWSTKTGREIQRFEKETDWVWSLDYAQDGSHVLSDRGSRVSVWDPRSGKEIRTFQKHQNWVYGVALSPNGQYAISGGSDRTVRLWKVADGQEMHVFRGHQGNVHKLDFSPDGRFAASASEDHTVRIWRLPNLSGLRPQATEQMGPGMPVGPSAIDSADRGSTAPATAVAPFDAVQARKHQRAWSNHLGLPVEREFDLGGQKIAMMLIPPGEFLMGSSAEDYASLVQAAKAANALESIPRIDREVPQHRVRISRPFYLGKHEMTQAQWQVVMGSNPSRFKAPQNPVVQVSWGDIQLLLAKLNQVSHGKGMKFALPTEAEWEYSCRAGTATFLNFSGTTWLHSGSMVGSERIPVRRPIRLVDCNPTRGAFTTCTATCGNGVPIGMGATARTRRRRIQLVQLQARRASSAAAAPFLLRNTVALRAALQCPPHLVNMTTDFGWR